MYLYPGVICLYRCLCGNRCICTGLIFAVADAFFETDVSATYFSLNLQILFSLSVMYNCIYILLFLCLADTLLCVSRSWNLSTNFLYQFLVRNVSPPSELNSNFSSTSFYKSNTMAIPQTPFHQSYFQV